MRKRIKIAALLTLALLPACGPQTRTSNITDIDAGNHNAKRKPPYIVGSGHLTYDPDDSSGISDLETIDIYFLWDQYRGKVDIYYGDNVGTPDLGKSLEKTTTGYSTEWRVTTDKETLAFYRYDTFQDGRFFVQSDNIPLGAYMFLDKDDLYLNFGGTDLKTQEFDRGYWAEDAFKALLTEHGLTR